MIPAGQPIPEALNPPLILTLADRLNERRNLNHG